MDGFACSACAICETVPKGISAVMGVAIRKFHFWEHLRNGGFLVQIRF